MRKAIQTAVTAVAVLLTMQAVASAAPFRLRIEDLSAGFGVVLTDNGFGDVNPLVGALTYSGVVSANFAVNVTTGQSQPLIGGIGDYGQLDLNSVNIATAGSGVLRLTIEDDNYFGPLTILTATGTANGTLSAPSGSIIELQGWANGGNLVPALGPDLPPSPLGPIGGTPAGSIAAWNPTFVSGPGAFSSVLNDAVFSNGANPTYSLFMQAVVTFSGAGSVSFHSNLRVTNAQTPAPVPEPASMLLLGTGLAGVGLLRRRKAR